ncbi:Sacchrp dh NADP domain-containing protein [Citrus sinensis]|uniref:Sacchrp dh NADP domain-containing protein n=1 Tax=Citrus sinensis TaxID=2711 RepID=A0ACB8MVW2_CITSI|nr:Sacchrp dh NADP domain-containing protein [Citrus sinensis]
MARALPRLNCTATAIMASATSATKVTVLVKSQFQLKNKNARVWYLEVRVGSVGPLLLLSPGSARPSDCSWLSKQNAVNMLVLGWNYGDMELEKGAAMVSTLGKNSEFAEVNIYNEGSLLMALRDVDLVVHAAGPFQQAPKCTVLEAAIETKTAYIDVCDDTIYSQRAKSFKDRAIAANIPAITTGGIYPGVSNVMAAELVRVARNESKGEPERLRIGLLCMLLLFLDCAAFFGDNCRRFASGFGGEDEEQSMIHGEEITLEPYSGMLSVDFGKGIGRKDVFLLNLPEVRSAREVLGVPTVSARFGTAPFFWNWGMVTMQRLFPAEYLRDRSKVQQLVQLFDPVVRAFDGIAGERVSMRVDLECTDGRNTVGIFSHRRLSVSVGTAIAAFVLAVLEGATQPGVWFPEEPEGIAIEAREVLLKRASQGTINFVMNK